MRKVKFNAGKWAVEKERQGLTGSTPPPPLPPQECLSDFIPGVLKRMGMKDQGWLADITAQWKDIAGPEIAANCRPGKYDRGMLTVYVTHPGWIQELKQRGEHLILERLKERFGSKRIKTIRFTIDPGDDA